MPFPDGKDFMILGRGKVHAVKMSNVLDRVPRSFS